MSIWTRIRDALSALAAGEGLAEVFDRLRSGPGPERSVGFTIAVIALGAKMAKADGTVTRDEVAARHGISLRSVDTLLRQALDHCAAQTGQTVIGGIGTARRALRTARAGFQPGPSSFAVAT